MTTGLNGAFLVSWAQTRLDGAAAAPIEDLTVGTTWQWSGEAVRIDAPGVALDPGAPEGADDMRRRAARIARRLVGAALGGVPDRSAALVEPGAQDAAPDVGFILTDGRQTFGATLIDTPGSRTRLLLFVGTLPPRDTDLWVVRTMLAPAMRAPVEETPGDVICFTPDALIRTESGVLPIAALQPGDRVLTRDNGPQEIVWIGQRRMSGARLYAMPALRPIRIRAGALGLDRPEPDLLVSPQHRILLRARSALALFDTPEVLVAAADLINNRSIVIDRSLREVVYVHVMFERHQVVWANGLECESFHPANTSLDLIEDAQRADLLALFPDISARPESYGDFARRNLTAPEAALLRQDSTVIAA